MRSMATPRALSFGPAAEAYERFRPGYPEQLYTLIAEYADSAEYACGGQRPALRTALEIGAGTGKATRLFAAHGLAVTATDPDAAMLAQLRRAVPAGATPVQAAFEDLRPAELGVFDLLYAGASLHWTEPVGRWERAAALLAPGGVFASFGGPIELADAEVRAAVRAARAPFLADDGIPSPDGTGPDAAMQWPGTELERSALFHDVRQAVVPRRLTVTAEEYTGHLSTVSAYLQLPSAQRAAVLHAVRDALPPRVDLNADVTLHLART